MKRKFLKDISANSIQVIINQLCGLGIFYVLSTHLSKSDFGEINWSLAVLLTLFGILACGIDQVVIRRIASGQNEQNILSVYISHVLLSGIMVYGLLLASEFLFPSFFLKHNLLLFLGIGKLMIFFSTPFKQLATGLEKFKPLLYMNICSNIFRSIALILLATIARLDMVTIIVIFIAGDLLELILCFFITQHIIKVPVVLRWDKQAYAGLVKESLPQLGVAIFTSVIARFDWIFLGLYTTSIILANYSFAYKIFEVSTLPMLVIAPVLIPRLTKIFHPAAGEITTVKLNDLFVLLRLEMVIASLVALVLNILWIPVIDFITTGKYGAVNVNTILLLSATMPFLYLNNYLWTINFAKGRLKMIFYIFLVTFLVNIAANIILIHFYNADGAAAAYLLTIISQSVMYLGATKLPGLKRNSMAVLFSPACALASGWLASYIFINYLAQIILACSVFLVLLFFTKQLRVSDWAVVKRVTEL